MTKGICIFLAAVSLSLSACRGKGDNKEGTATPATPAPTTPVKSSCQTEWDLSPDSGLPSCSAVAGMPDPSLSATATSIAFGATSTVSASGGTPPYVYYVASGYGRVDSSTGVFTGSSSGTSVVRVYDNECHTADISISVSQTAGTTTPDDTHFVQLWGLTKIFAPAAWSMQTDCRDSIIAVIDTGVDYNHPDLVDNIWSDVDSTHGYDFYNVDTDPMDDNLHGTHVAGTIAARGNNTLGVVGGCWRAQIMPIKFLGADGAGYTSDAVSAVDYARTKGAKIMNNSWGGAGYSLALYNAIEAANSAGALFVAASGNSGLNLESTPQYPASFTNRNVLSVGASTSVDTKPSWSNYGACSVDVFAPGSNIKSTMPTFMTADMTANGYSTDYGILSGTSMAAPTVSALAALAWQGNTSQSVVDVKKRIFRATEQPSGLTESSLYGRVRADWVLDYGRKP